MASFVRFVVSSNYGSTVTGFSEAQFDDTPVSVAVTEPISTLGIVTAISFGIAFKRSEG